MAVRVVPCPLGARRDCFDRHPVVLGDVLVAAGVRFYRVGDGFDHPVALVDAGNSADEAGSAGREPGIDGIRARHGYPADLMGMSTYR